MTRRIQHALIMAAGRGQRMSPLTDVVPKPMVPYADSTLIATGIERVRKHIPNIHVTVGYKGAMLAQHLIEHGVTSIFNTDGQPNSWWIFHTLLQKLDEPVFVLTCDNVTDLDFASLEDDYVRQGEPPCMVVGVAPVPGVEGDFIFHDQNRILKISRRERGESYCTGIQVLNPAKINRSMTDARDFYAIWDHFIQCGELLVSSVKPKRWFSIDTIADLERAQESKVAAREASGGDDR
jgi:NDP-sugar pyrophosphorylase family protein